MPDKGLVLETKMVDTKGLVVFHKNPRVGNVDAIAESLSHSGQYKPIVVNKGTHTGRKNEILCGNHTYLASRRLGWTKIYASIVDVDDTLATTIVLADNKTADLGTYEEQLLAELFGQLPDAEGTGYSQAEFDTILADVAQVAEVAMGAAEEYIEERRNEAELAAKRNTFDGSPLGEEASVNESDPVIPDTPSIDKAPEELKGAYQLKNTIPIDPVNWWGVPKLLPDLIPTFDEIPPNLTAWAGSATKDWPDPDQWWLYNWGIDSTSGMRDVSKVIVSFYAYDQYFEGWWDYPERYTAKVLNSGIKYILTPNYSQDTDEPRLHSLMQIYRARWLGRYFQEAGLKVIPDITWRDGDTAWLREQVLETLPPKPNMIAIQIQTIDPKQTTGGVEQFVSDVNTVFRELQPRGALVYTGKQGEALIKDGSIKINCPNLIIGSRQEKLSAMLKGREKKLTI